MTKNPLALASALRKISADPDIEAVKREDVAQLFIQHPGKQATSALRWVERAFCDTILPSKNEYKYWNSSER